MAHRKHSIIKASYIRNTHNFLLVWLDLSTNGSYKIACPDAITQFRQTTNSIKLFTNVDQCIDYITDITEEKAFIILSGAIVRSIVSIVQDICQINSIYIWCENVSAEHEQWTKVKGVFTQISSICEALKDDARYYDHNAISISFILPTDGVSNQNLDQLDQSFMYSQILKEILLTIDFDQQHIIEFTTYCREQFNSNSIELQNIDKLEKEYHEHMPIWWYTYQSCLYSILNQALRTMKVDIIIKMGFFLRDLHQNIVQLYTKQYINRVDSTAFTVYRGQGMSHKDFDQLMKTKGGLMSFNNLLSTSRDRDVSFAFAESNQYDQELIGVLFEITVDPSNSSTPFANIRSVSYFQEEDEILFSMHSVFRIGQIKQMDNNNNHLWQVELTLTKDNDPQLHALTEYIRNETFPTEKGWFRLSALLIQLGKFDKAQQVCKLMINQASDESEKANIYHMIGRINERQGKYTEAIKFYENSIENNMRILPSNHPLLAYSYAGIAVIHSKMSEYMKAISFHEKALEIFKEFRPSSDQQLATCYDNIGTVYGKMDEHTKALLFKKQALEIYQKILPSNHPDLGFCYSNIAAVYMEIDEYDKALQFLEKTLTIFEKILPPDHPTLAPLYDNIGVLNRRICKYSKAISYYEKALKIFQNTLPLNHPDLAICYGNIGVAYNSMHDYSKALFYYEV